MDTERRRSPSKPAHVRGARTQCYRTRRVSKHRWHKPRVSCLPDLEDRRRLVAEDSWGLVESQNQYLAAIARLHQEVDQNLDISDRIERFQNRLEEAMQLLTTVTEEGAAVNREHLTRLTALTEP